MAAKVGPPQSVGVSEAPWVLYTLRAVRGGQITSMFIIGIVVLYLLLPGHTGFNKTAIAALVVVAGVLTAAVAFLPWPRMANHPVGKWAIGLWAIVMVGIIDLAIAFTGGSRSELYLALIVATVFTAALAYPLLVETGLTAVTAIGYVLTLAGSGWGITGATLLLRIGMIVASALAVKVLNNELGRAFHLQSIEHKASMQRVVLWSRMAAMVREIDSPDADRVLAAVVEALEALGFESSDICAVDASGDTYEVLHARNLNGAYTDNHHPTSGGLVARVLSERRTVVVPDYATLADGVSALRCSGFGTVVGGPVWVDGELAAILEAATAERRALPAETIAAFEMLTTQAGHALENAHLLARQRRDRDHFRQLLGSTPDAMVVADATTGLLVEVNKQAEILFGYDAEDLIGQPADLLMPVRFRTGQLSMIDQWLQHGGDSVIGVDRSVFALRRDGTELPVEVTFSTFDTPEGRVISAAIRDITVRREFERRLAHQATHDRLTGLPNRELFTQQLARSLHGRLTVDPPMTVCLLDLDHFKYLNDSRGHRAGDNLVIEVAHRIGRLLDGEFIARVGGDEFGLLIEGATSTSEAVAFGDRLLALFAEPFDVDDVDCYITASIGIAFGCSSDRAEVLLSNADAAVNRAKHNGRNRIELFDETLTLEAAERIATEAQLHVALERGEFFLVYQPVISLFEERLVGMEALIRWNQPSLGQIPPSQFIPIAEKCGLIVPIGRWVLSEACRQLAAWRERYPRRNAFSISINVSSRQLEHDHFVNEVSEVLASTGIPPRLLVLEITESFFIRDFQAAERRLHALKGLGVRLAIDDFGTGFSSLFSLSRLPVDVVKIDKAFIDGLGARYDAVVTAVVTLGAAFGLDVVAEGIEQAEQRDRLIELGCGYAQGFYFSIPLEVADAERVLHPGHDRSSVAH